MIDNIMCTK